MRLLYKKVLKAWEEQEEDANMKEQIMLSLREVANEPEFVSAREPQTVPLDLSAAWGAKGFLIASAAWGGKPSPEAKPRSWKGSTLRTNSPAWSDSTAGRQK